MQIEELFDKLTAKLQNIEDEWPTAATNEKVKLAEDLLGLREISDQVVDLWLHFEEKLTTLLKQIREAEEASEQLSSNPEVNKTEPPAAFSTKSASTQSVPPGKSATPAPFAEKWKADVNEPVNERERYLQLFRKGEGFYHLRLFADAKQCFANLLRESPDWESGRLYFAYSLLFCEEKEAAMKEFRLLSKAASSPKVIAISYNAIGCLLVEEEQWLEAAQAFKTALKEMPLHRESLFNLALCYLYNGEAQEALEAIEEYMQVSDNDWDAQHIWSQAARLLAGSGSDTELIIPSQLMSPAGQCKPETLRDLAFLFESTGQYHRAQLCYHDVIEQLPREGWGWHGLAWITWLISGTRRALTMMKKAICLAPDNLDYVFSYGWMMLFDGKYEEAIEAFRSILLKEQNHRLAQSGLITAYGMTGEYLAAKTLAKSFLTQSDEFLSSLGFYHLGRLAVFEENWLLAEQYFRKVKGRADQFREVPLYLQLCASKMGKPFVLSDGLLQPQ